MRRELDSSVFSRRNKQLLLATVTIEPGRGGISVVARVLRKVFEETGQTSVLESGIKPSRFQKLCFALACWQMQLRHQVSTIVFDQIGIAQVQNVLLGKLKVPYAVFIHGIEVWRPMSPFERHALLGASAIFCNSHHTYTRALAANPWIPEPVVVPLCLQTDYQPSRLNDLPFQPIVLTVGRLDRYKGHEEILNIWPRLLKRVPEAVYWIVGDGDKMSYLRAQVHALGVERSVKFWGFVPNEVLPDLYAQCAVFAMPSYGEGFGLVYLEAMRHRKPCVGSVHDAASEVIVHGETGLLVDQRNSEELENVLVDLLRNPEICCSLGKAGYERERTAFTYESFRAIVRRVIAELDPS